jgi:translation elongation factor EF-4
LSVHEKAKQMENVQTIIPALTKIDLPASRAVDVALSVSDLFGFDPDAVLLTSARSRLGVSDILESVCKNIPPPKKLPDDDDVDTTLLRAQVVDSWFEPLRGVVCLVQVLSGELHEGSRVSIIEPYAKIIDEDKEGVPHNYNAKEHFSIQETGLVLPHRLRTGTLGRGQMGYVIVGLRDPRQARPGTIMTLQKDLSTVVNMHLPRTCFAGVGGEDNAAKSVLYASVHPMEGEGFDELSAAIDKLALNDTGLEIQRTAGNSNNDGGPFLGPGLRVSFS